MESTIKQEVEKKLQDKQKSKEFKDVGRVSNTRKELAAYRLVNIENLNDLEQDKVIAFNLVKKENVWKPIDIASEKEKGTSPGAAYLKVEIRKSLPAKPKDGEGFRKAYVLGLTTLQNDLEPCRNMEDILNLCNKYRSFNVYDFTINFVEALPEGMSKEAFEETAKKRLGYFRVSKALTESLGVRFYNLISRSSDAAIQTWKDARELDPVSELIASLVIENLNKRKEKSIESINAQIKSYIEADIPTLKQILLKEFNKDGWINKTFKSLPEDSRRLAINYRENQLKTLIEAYDKQISEAKAKDGDWSWALKEESTIEDGEKVKKVKGKSINTKTPLSYIKRTGGFAITDISVQSIVNNFGFTSVNYGNYVDDKWSKDHTKHFLGAMSDLGEILNIDIKKLTQLGGLNIAFGAKGRPGHLATYFPQTKDINLTRGNGDGSLAHEYGHYIDNVLMEGKAKSTTSLFISESKRSDNPVLNRLFKELIDFMIRGEQGITPLLPVRFYPQKQKDVPTIYYRSYNAVIELKGTIEETLAQEEVKKICILDSAYHSTQNRVLGYIIDAFGLDYYDVPLRLKTSHFYYKSAYNAFNYNTLVDGKYKITGDNRTKYWTSTVELFARAFETVILKKFLDKNRVSNYLVADIETKDIISEHYFSPYPTGAELQKIEGMIDEIILNIKQHYSIGDFVPPSELREDEYIDLSESGSNEAGMVVEDKKESKQITFVEEDKAVKVVNVEHWQMSLEDFLNENKEYKKLIEKTQDYEFRLIEARKKDVEAYSKKSQGQIRRSMSVGRFDKNESTVKERIEANDKKIKELKEKLQSEHKDLVLAAIKEGKDVPEMNVLLYNPPAEKTIDPSYKATFIEKRLKALNISARFSKDELLNKRIKALELTLRMIGKKFSGGGGVSTLLAPNGKPSNLTPEQYKLVREPSFLAWFGDWINDPKNASKVVDSNGEPLVCYHGTRNYNRFYKFRKGSKGYLGGGIYFTSNKENSKGYARYGTTLVNQYECFLDIKDPFNVTGSIGTDDFLNKLYGKTSVYKNRSNKQSFDTMIVTSSDIKKLLNEGYDGIYWDTAEEFVVYESTQIKLADGTNTTFDPKNPDIRFRTGGDIPAGFNMEMEAKAIQLRTGMPIDLSSLRKEGYKYVFKYKGQSKESDLSVKLVQDTISMNRKSLEGRTLFGEGGGVDAGKLVSNIQKELKILESLKSNLVKVKNGSKRWQEILDELEAHREKIMTYIYDRFDLEEGQVYEYIKNKVSDPYQKVKYMVVDQINKHYFIEFNFLDENFNSVDSGYPLYEHYERFYSNEKTDIEKLIGLFIKKKLVLLSDYKWLKNERTGQYYIERPPKELSENEKIWKSIKIKFNDVYFVEESTENLLSSNQVKYDKPFYNYTGAPTPYRQTVSWNEAEAIFKKSLTKEELDTIKISYKKEDYSDAEEHDQEKEMRTIIVFNKETIIDSMEDGYKYVFKKDIDGRGFSESFDSFEGLVKKYGTWVDVDWTKVQQDINKIKSGSLLLKKAGEEGNNFGYNFYVIKVKPENETPKEALKKEIIQGSIDDGFFEEQIKDGKKTVEEIIGKIEAVGLKVPESILKLKKSDNSSKLELIEKRLKALKISLRFSKDKEMVEKRIKALGISLKSLEKQKFSGGGAVKALRPKQLLKKFDEYEDKIKEIQYLRHELHSESENNIFNDSSDFDGKIDKISEIISEIDLVGNESEISGKIQRFSNAEGGDRLCIYDFEVEYDGYEWENDEEKDSTLDSFKSDAFEEIKKEKEEINNVIENYLGELDKLWDDNNLDSLTPNNHWKNKPFKPSGYLRSRLI
jgi:hypothetical protein